MQKHGLFCCDDFSGWCNGGVVPLLINNNVSSIVFYQTRGRGAGKSARKRATKDETCLFIFRVGDEAEALPVADAAKRRNKKPQATRWRSKPPQFAPIAFLARRGCIAISGTFGTFGHKST